MSDTTQGFTGSQAVTPSGGETFGDSTSAVRAAAETLVRERGYREDDNEAPSPPLDLNDRADAAGVNRGVNAREAAVKLTEYREAQAEQQRAIDAALGLDDGTGEAASAPEAPRQPTPEESAAAYRQYEQHIAAEWQRVQAYSQSTQQAQAVQYQAAVLDAQFRTEFPGVNTLEDLQYLASIDPSRSELAGQYLTAYHNLAQQHGAANQQAQHAMAVQYDAWAKHEDKLFEERHPEVFKDPKVARHMSDVVIKELKAIGLTEAEMQELWLGKTGIHFRDSRAQDIILDAVRYRQAVKGARQRGPAPAPKVQRPGVHVPPLQMPTMKAKSCWGISERIHQFETAQGF